MANKDSFTSKAFPNVNITALKKWAITTAAKIHPPKVAQRGKKTLARTTPKIISCEDVRWAGTEMILLTFDPKSMPLGPQTMLAHFPVGRQRLTTQALVGMTDSVIRYKSGRINAPRLYAFIDFVPNDIGAETVLMEKVPGETLEDLWPNLSQNDRFQVLVKVAELLCHMFNHRGTRICTDLLGTGVDTRPIAPNEPPRNTTQLPVLLAPPFDEGPLIDMAPQSAVETTKQYLVALAYRIERVFCFNPDGSPSNSNVEGRAPPHPDTPALTYLDVQRIRDTWHRLALLIHFHTGGFFVPSSTPSRVRDAICAVLQSRQFGIRHADMQMRRIIVQKTPSTREGVEHEFNLILTGWEYAFRAPLWSCARLPPWFMVRVEGMPEAIPNEQKAYYRDLLVGRIMNDDRMLRISWQWFVAYIYGETERWLEGCLSMDWFMRDHIEWLLPYLKNHWETYRPDVAFPLKVGKEYAPPGDTARTAAERPGYCADPALATLGGGSVGGTLGEEWKELTTKWADHIPPKKRR